MVESSFYLNGKSYWVVVSSQMLVVEICASDSHARVGVIIASLFRNKNSFYVVHD